MKLSLEQEAHAWGTRRIVRLTGIENDSRRQHEILFDLAGEAALSAPPVLDGFVMAVIFYAMRIGEDIHVDGSLSQEAVMNLREFQEAWRCWRPAVYRPISISATNIVRTMPSDQKPRAISAFSGGLDACFTLARHRLHLLGDCSYPLDSVMMVHGFDIPLDHSASFDALVARVRPVLGDLGVQLRIVRTNLRSLNLQDWEDSHIAQLAGCLHNFSSEFRYALVGSAKPYANLHIPYGSNPISDPLLSGAAMRLVHDGAGFSRTEKAAFLARFPRIRSAIKVCWESDDPSRNCGVCEKCVRTQLNFLAAGCSRPECFDRPLDENLIRTITFLGDGQLREWASIRTFAERIGLHDRWLTLVKRRLAAHRLRTPVDAYWFAEFKLRRGVAKLRRWAGMHPFTR